VARVARVKGKSCFHGTLVHTLMEHDLVDEYRMMVTRTFSPGVVVQHHRPPAR
jgi:hypothetical protein